MTTHPFTRFVTGIVAVLAGLTTFALAGPPLVCHPIDIGSAKTLPWVDLNYRKGDGGFDLNSLPRETLAILDSNPSVLVHMETLRRATIYARQDQQVAKELLVRLHARAETSASSNALAWFDAGYLAETYRQWLGSPNPAGNVDGYAWVTKAIQMRGQDPEMEFAAALITLTGPERDHQAHVQRAMAGAKTDPPLAQNLTSRFRNQTISALLSSGEEGLKK
jgi:hypothetical protein